MQRPRPAVLFGFVALCVVMRLAPWTLELLFGFKTDPKTTIYPWNFAPFMAVCLFVAAFLRDRRLAYALMLGSWLVGDLAIGLLKWDAAFAFYPSQVTTYLGYGLVITLGLLLRERRSALAIGGTGLLGAVIFFAVSNFGVWAFGGGVTYPMTPGGLLECYDAAIPFFRNSLISMAVFLPVLFSPIAVTTRAPEPSPTLAAQAG